MSALLPPNEIESELSYAYLHAVAAKAGMACEVRGRHADKIGLDSEIIATGDFGDGAVLTDISLHVQLKAIIAEPTVRNEQIPYFLKGVDRYDKLRKPSVSTHRILVVLFLPRDSAEWLQWSEERLVLQRCAWWVSLRGASPSDNGSGVTVYLPKNQAFGPDELERIMARLACEEELQYNG